VLLFLFSLDRWAQRPSHERSAAVGAAFALAALCKLTAPAFCLPLGFSWLVARRWATGTWTAEPSRAWPPRRDEVRSRARRCHCRAPGLAQGRRRMTESSRPA